MSLASARLRRAATALGLRSPRPVILMYHRVADLDSDPWRLAVPPARFEAQMARLRDTRVVLPLSVLAKRLAAGDLPARAAAVTFDDGYACNWTAAAPILARTGVPATFFLTTGTLGGIREFWWDELEQLVMSPALTGTVALPLGGETLELDLGATPDDPARLKAWNAMEPPQTKRQAAYVAAWRALGAAGDAERRGALDALWNAAGLTPGAREAYRTMTHDEARALARQPGLDVGAHSVSHADFTTLGPEAQTREIASSREACEAIAGRGIPAFAYPFGRLAANSPDLVRQAGFACACTTEPGPVTRGTDPFRLPRLQVLDWPMMKFGGTLNAL